MIKVNSWLERVRLYDILQEENKIFSGESVLTTEQMNRKSRNVK